MSQLKIEYAKGDHPFPENGIADFLNKVLPVDAEAVLDPENELVHQLLSYHSDDGGAVTLTRLKLDWVEYDAEKKAGKICFKYHLAWHYACSYSDKDYEKTDKVDFVIDQEAGFIVLTFLDPNTRSTAEEF
ncbi:MAG TPA: hypothetical protein VK541_12135 [Pedobacter sp.]|uniref:hypothetical protein n=1 Tax=Pedobacter sp. TaxID=1411316 RepID=UPI002BD6EC6E|nr:hypothetical protein [Pedobacter sp.]HMI03228.1 hypothetical protein [Pedobacter sp.]